MNIYECLWRLELKNTKYKWRESLHKNAEPKKEMKNNEYNHIE